MSGELYNRKRTCKAQYRRGLRQRQRDTCCEISNELHDCLMQKNGASFWKTWNSKFKQRKNHCASVGGYTNSIDIANAFADNFATVCHHDTPPQNDRLKCEFINKLSNYRGSTDNVLFDSELVQVAIAKIRTGKAPGIDGVTAEHVLNCHPTISLHLLTLFNAIVKHNYVPAEFGFGVTIPLLKDDNVDRSNIDNYRAITISPVLS